MRTIDVAERRARIGVRHALAPAHHVTTPADAARTVAALHSTDPSTVVLSVLARTSGLAPADVEHALYESRELVRVMAMRRTVFVAAREHATLLLAGAGDDVARTQRRLLEKLVTQEGHTDDASAWVAAAADRLVEAVAHLGEATSTEIAAADPLLALRVDVGGDGSATPTVASRLLTVLGAEGRVVRTRPRGGWTSTQFRWATHARWLGSAPPTETEPTADDAATGLARLWLATHGPATIDDLRWWTGWGVTRTRAALARLDVVEVDLSGVPGIALADDLEPVPAPDPWVALLPALDPSVMGWKQREFLLGPHAGQLFDTTGNAGPTVWSDGRVVGGWVQRPDGEVVVELLEDVGAEVHDAALARAAALTDLLGDVRLSARGRRYSPIEARLRS